MAMAAATPPPALLLLHSDWLGHEQSRARWQVISGERSSRGGDLDMREGGEQCNAMVRGAMKGRSSSIKGFKKLPEPDGGLFGPPSRHATWCDCDAIGSSTIDKVMCDAPERCSDTEAILLGSLLTMHNGQGTRR
ncbi:hypothetical protein TWF106_003807 [Orbilia oligospora]|uniref:Uncharacterized protein n=1 Tax=Orbilia oligospora TaxID=2813651 RepID=A0A6G1M9L2_ORBOL|nr:hypothetical protein TWF788_009140 [Orbilia oligospora]KAF3199437.1 hypothetical protein TWF106_003807 [Orbilia oligospora]KAF3202415.1 hypothetical protein TWF679_010811 [Orbilia oligospora]KAF3205224.1 hypothetical protein TWF191_001933 [Orbilia oligospora]KAF3251011.1 hypothetical protein TWF192_004989 [Orbilia oligospora]